VVWTDAGTLRLQNYSFFGYSGAIINLAGGLFDVRDDGAIS